MFDMISKFTGKNFDNAAWLTQGLVNSVLPEALDKDEITWEDMNPKSQAALKKFIDAKYEAEPWTGKRGFKYEDLNDFFKSKSIFEGGDAFSDVGALKTALGQFAVERFDDGGYEVSDTYDFNKGSKYGDATWGNIVKSFDPSMEAPGGFKGRAYRALRLLGENRIPVGSPNAMSVRMRIPGRKQVVEPMAPTVTDATGNQTDDTSIFQKISNFIMPGAQAADRQEVYRQPNDVFTDELQKNGWEGATVLSPQEETAFRQWFVQSPFYKEFQNEHGRVPDIDDPDYDYRGLWKSYGDDAFSRNEGDGRYHGFSRAKDGKWLKNPAKHPTAWKEVAMSALNPKFLAERYNIVDDRQLAQAIDAPNSDRAAWAKILQQSRDWEANQAATTVAAERSPVSQTYAAQPNYDKLSFGEAFRQAMKNPDTVAKGRFMWRGRPYATQYAKGQ